MNNKTITIQCTDIYKSFNQAGTVIESLRGVNLTAYSGEMIMLMGPSGSGKTTLISIIGGITASDKGTCLVLGQSMEAMSVKEKTVFRGRNLGFIFQSFNLVPMLSALENTSVPLLLNNYKRAEALVQAKELLGKMSLTSDQQNRVPKNLSGGEQQRVAIARGCIHKPAVILCDEPTSFLDSKRGEAIMQLLTTIKQEYNCTIIVVTHDQRILHFADRIVYLDDGLLKDKEAV